MVALIRGGRWFDKDAYKDISEILRDVMIDTHRNNTVCTIIPVEVEANLSKSPRRAIQQSTAHSGRYFSMHVEI